jgi:hypothetical protein
MNLQDLFGLVTYEGLGLALAVLGAVTVAIGMVGVAGFVIDRVASHYDTGQEQ